MYSSRNAGSVLFTGAVLFITGVHLAEFIYPVLVWVAGFVGYLMAVAGS